MTTTDPAAIKDYLDGLPEPEAALFPEPAEGADPLVDDLVISTLVWNATPTQANAALGRLREAASDYNELRICLPDEVESLLGPRYPLVAERTDRLLRMLNAVFASQHAMTLDVLRDTSKRDAKAFLDELNGILPFIAGRVFLLGLGGHAFPVDDRTAAALVELGLLEDDIDSAGASARCERALRAGEAAPAFRRLEAAMNQKLAKPAAGRRKRAAGGAKPKRSSSKS